MRRSALATVAAAMLAVFSTTLTLTLTVFDVWVSGWTEGPQQGFSAAAASVPE